MKAAPRDVVTQRHTCELQFLPCFLLVVQEQKDIHNLLPQYANIGAQYAAFNSSAAVATSHKADAMAPLHNR